MASHVRLFKSARYKYKSPLKVKHTVTVVCHGTEHFTVQEGEARATDLETVFFDFEVLL